jgi:hypothetical protein
MNVCDDVWPENKIFDKVYPLGENGNNGGGDAV